MVGGLVPDTAVCGDAVVLGLVSIYWWVRPGPGSGYSLEDRDSWSLWLQGTGVLEFISACWWIRLKLRLS